MPSIKEAREELEQLLNQRCICSPYENADFECGPHGQEQYYIHKFLQNPEEYGEVI